MSTDMGLGIENVREGVQDTRLEPNSKGNTTTQGYSQNSSNYLSQPKVEEFGENQIQTED